MRRIVKPFLITCGIVCSLCLVFASRPRAADAPTSRSGSEPAANVQTASKLDSVHAATDFRYVGSASCAAAACHGGDGSGQSWQSSYSTWAQKDAHAGAFTVLYNAESRLMAKNLGLKVPAHQAKVCLACHATVVDQSLLAEHHGFDPLDGVSCESCHGPAEKWFGPHVQADWAGQTMAQKQALGYVNTENLFRRAEMCVSCHVGAPGRDVNHDLIAAGHPRLNFEYSAFMANMPPHWSRKHDTEANSPTLEAQVWAIGQVVSARAAIELLENRSATQKPAWPEFSEYDCFACHHNLSVESWRQARSFGDDGYRLGFGRFRQPAGSYSWGSWSLPLIPALTNELAGPMAVEQIVTAIEDLRQEMIRPYPRTDEVQKLTKPLKEQLGRLETVLGDKQMSADVIRKLLTHLAADDGGQILTKRNWDAATQVYLAAVALHIGYHESQGLPPAPTDGENGILGTLTEIRDALEFPRHYESPETFSGKRIETINERLSRLQKNLR